MRKEIEKRKNKKERGITLIALILTIIILLILAGVTISMLSGDNGIITRVGNAKDAIEQSSLKEEVGLAVSSYRINKQTEGIGDLEAELRKIQEASVEEIEEGTYYVERAGYGVTVSEDGEKYHVCIGSYSVEGGHAGYYARISQTPRIDSYAADIPVLIDNEK